MMGVIHPFKSAYLSKIPPNFIDECSATYCLLMPVRQLFILDNIVGSKKTSDDKVSSLAPNQSVSTVSTSTQSEEAAHPTLASSVRRATRLALKAKPVKEVKNKMSPEELSRAAERLSQRRMKKMTGGLAVPKTFKEVTGTPEDMQFLTDKGKTEVNGMFGDGKASLKDSTQAYARLAPQRSTDVVRQEGDDLDVTAPVQAPKADDVGHSAEPTQVTTEVLKVSVDTECKRRTPSKANRTEPEATGDDQMGRAHERVDMVLGLDRVPKTNSRGRATRNRIIEAARRILIEQGTDKLSIDRVLEEAKVSKGSFIHHYPSRSALIEALVDSYAQHLDEVQRELEHKARMTSKVPSRLLRAYGDWYREFSEGRIDRGISPFAALAVASPENRQLMTPVRCWYREYFNRVKREPCGPTTALIVTLAYDALFFHQLLGTDVLTSQEKRHIVEGLERLSGNITHTSSAPDFDPDLNSELASDDPFEQ